MKSPVHKQNLNKKTEKSEREKCKLKKKCSLIYRLRDDDNNNNKNERNISNKFYDPNA